MKNEVYYDKLYTIKLTKANESLISIIRESSKFHITCKELGIKRIYFDEKLTKIQRLENINLILNKYIKENYD